MHVLGAVCKTLGCKPHMCAAKTQDGATEYQIELRVPNMQPHKSCRVADENGQESIATTHELCRKVDLRSVVETS